MASLESAVACAARYEQRDAKGALELMKGIRQDRENGALPVEFEPLAS